MPLPEQPWKANISKRLLISEWALGSPLNEVTLLEMSPDGLFIRVNYNLNVTQPNQRWLHASRYHIVQVLSDAPPPPTIDEQFDERVEKIVQQTIAVLQRQGVFRRRFSDSKPPESV